MNVVIFAVRVWAGLVVGFLASVVVLVAVGGMWVWVGRFRFGRRHRHVLTEWRERGMAEVEAFLAHPSSRGEGR